MAADGHPLLVARSMEEGDHKAAAEEEGAEEEEEEEGSDQMDDTLQDTALDLIRKHRPADLLEVEEEEMRSVRAQRDVPRRSYSHHQQNTNDASSSRYQPAHANARRQRTERSNCPRSTERNELE